MFINLLTNAIKFTPNNGQIRLSSLTTDEGFVQVNVADNGAGIKQDELFQVFDKFRQVQAKSSGTVRSTGLGLTFCKMAVEAHGGEIGVDSQVGKGSTFWLLLPNSDETFSAKQSSNQHQALQLSQDHQKLLKPYLKKLQSLKIYEFSKINHVLADINALGNEQLQLWTQEVKNCSLTMNEEAYRKMVEN